MFKTWTTEKLSALAIKLTKDDHSAGLMDVIEESEDPKALVNMYVPVPGITIQQLTDDRLLPHLEAQNRNGEFISRVGQRLLDGIEKHSLPQQVAKVAFRKPITHTVIKLRLPDKA